MHSIKVIALILSTSMLLYACERKQDTEDRRYLQRGETVEAPWGYKDYCAREKDKDVCYN